MQRPQQSPSCGTPLKQGEIVSPFRFVSFRRVRFDGHVAAEEVPVRVARALLWLYGTQVVLRAGATRHERSRRNEAFCRCGTIVVGSIYVRTTLDRVTSEGY